HPGPLGLFGFGSGADLRRLVTAHAATTFGCAFVLVESSPGAVLLGLGDGVVQAFGPDGASGAEHFRPGLPGLLLLGALVTVRPEEQLKGLVPTYGVLLPVQGGPNQRPGGDVTPPCGKTHRHTPPW